MRPHLTLLAAHLLAAASSAHATSPFFAVDGSMEANGWKESRAQRQDSFTVKDGVLTAVCSPNPYKGALYSRDVELPEKGELTFEMQQGCGRSNRYYMQVCAGNLMLSFAGDSLMRYFPRPKPNWKVVARHRVPNGIWTRIRVVWDSAERCIRYYAGDMRIPSDVENDAVIGPDENSSRHTLRIGNYGLAEEFQTHRLRNLAFGAASADSLSPDGVAIVFHGLGSEFFPIDAWTRGFDKENVVDFFLDYRGSRVASGNDIALSAYPDERLCRGAKLIVLADMPLENRVIPHSAQSNLLAAVASGARMIVTGGMAGLEKCGDYDAPIAKALPVRLESPWRRPSGGDVVRASYGRGKIAVVNRTKTERKR